MRAGRNRAAPADQPGDEESSRSLLEEDRSTWRNLPDRSRSRQFRTVTRKLKQLSTAFRNYADVLIWTSHRDTETRRRPTRSACHSRPSREARKPQTNDRSTVQWSFV